MKRLKYGMITNPARDILSEIRTAHRMGFDYVEIGIEIPEGHPDILRRRRRAILRALKPFRHIPVAHTAYWFDLWSEYEEVRRAWVEVGRKSIDVAALLGCVRLNIHAPMLNGMYKYIESNRKAALNNTVRSLRELVRYGRGMGIRVMMENMPDPGCMRLREFAYIMEGVPGLGAHIDTGHAFVEGGMPMVSRYIRTFRERLEHLHFSDNMGEQDDHVGIGQGAMDYFRVMRLLRRIRYDKGISLEIFSSMKDLRNSLKIIRAIEEEAWQG
jgi:sugar phosphate isomerase/epimerase